LDTQPSFKILITEPTKVPFKNGRGDHAPRAPHCRIGWVPNSHSSRDVSQLSEWSTLVLLVLVLLSWISFWTDYAFLLSPCR